MPSASFLVAHAAIRHSHPGGTWPFSASLLHCALSKTIPLLCLLRLAVAGEARFGHQRGWRCQELSQAHTTLAFEELRSQKHFALQQKTEIHRCSRTCRPRHPPWWRSLARRLDVLLTRGTPLTDTQYSGASCACSVRHTGHKVASSLCWA